MFLNRYHTIGIVALALTAGCVSKGTYEECQAVLATATTQRDGYQTERDERNKDLSKCLTLQGTANDEKNACIGQLKTTQDSYSQCRDDCMIQEFEAFQQRTKEEYQAQVDAYKQTSSEEYRVQIERVTQEALAQQKQLQARIAELEQRVGASEED